MYDITDEVVGSRRTTVSNGGGALKMRTKITTKPHATPSTVDDGNPDAVIYEADEKKKKVLWACKYCDMPPFDSDKAVYGHMRMHNSRKRRPKEEEGAVKKIRTDLDLDKYSSQKRLNTGTAPAVDDDDVLNAAIILMSFANPTEYSRSRLGSGRLKSGDDLDLGLRTSHGHGGKGNCDKEENKEILETRARDLDGDYSTNGDHTSSTAADINVSLRSRRAKGTSGGGGGVETSDDHGREGRSNTCRIQGGHMAKHNRDKDRDGHCSDQNGQGQSKKLHYCSVCNKSFEKGQSLGGHMRRHFVPPGTEAPGGPPPSPPPSLGEGADCNRVEGSCSSGRYAAEGTGCHAHDFDLKESPEQ